MIFLVADNLVLDKDSGLLSFSKLVLLSSCSWKYFWVKGIDGEYIDVEQYFRKGRETKIGSYQLPQRLIPSANKITNCINPK